MSLARFDWWFGDRFCARKVLNSGCGEGTSAVTRNTAKTHEVENLETYPDIQDTFCFEQRPRTNLSTAFQLETWMSTLLCEEQHLSRSSCGAEWISSIPNRFRYARSHYEWFLRLRGTCLVGKTKPAWHKKAITRKLSHQMTSITPGHSPGRARPLGIEDTCFQPAFVPAAYRVNRCSRRPFIKNAETFHQYRNTLSSI